MTILSNTLQHTATHCNTLQHTATPATQKHRAGGKYDDVKQHSATHCNTLQHTATHCNTLQHRNTELEESMTILTAQPSTAQKGNVFSNVHLMNQLRCVLQCVAACCSVLQCVAVCYSVLQSVAKCCQMWQCVATVQKSNAFSNVHLIN